MMKRVLFFLCLSGLVFGFAAACSKAPRQGDRNGMAGAPEAPAVEVKVMKRAVEGGEGAEAYIMLTFQVNFPPGQAAGDIVFLTSKSKFGGTRVEINSPSDKLALKIQPAKPGHEKKFDVLLINQEMHGFAGKFEPDAPLSEFRYELPEEGETLSAPFGKRLTLAAARLESAGGPAEFFEIFLETRSVDTLIAVYHKAQPLQKESTLEKIKKTGDASTLVKVFELLKDEPDAHLRMLIIAAAEALGNEAAVEPALRYLETETAVDPRCRIFYMLGNFRSRRGFEVLSGVLRSTDADIKERIYAALALGRYETGKAQELLLAILFDDSKPYELRSQAATALAGHPGESLLEKIRNYHKTLEKGSRTEKLIAGLAEYLQKAISGELEGEKHKHE